MYIVDNLKKYDIDHEIFNWFIIEKFDGYFVWWSMLNLCDQFFDCL